MAEPLKGVVLMQLLCIDHRVCARCPMCAIVFNQPTPCRKDIIPTYFPMIKLSLREWNKLPKITQRVSCKTRTGTQDSTLSTELHCSTRPRLSAPSPSLAYRNIRIHEQVLPLHKTIKPRGSACRSPAVLPEWCPLTSVTITTQMWPIVT